MGLCRSSGEALINEGHVHQSSSLANYYYLQMEKEREIHKLVTLIGGKLNVKNID